MGELAGGVSAVMGVAGGRGVAHRSCPGTLDPPHLYEPILEVYSQLKRLEVARDAGECEDLRECDGTPGSQTAA